MNGPQKIDQVELDELQNLKNEIQKNIFEFGVLYMEKLELDDLRKSLSEKESNLMSKNSDFKKQESDLMDKILKKYGEGSLNVKDGTFTKS